MVSARGPPPSPPTDTCAPRGATIMEEMRVGETIPFHLLTEIGEPAEVMDTGTTTFMPIKTTVATSLDGYLDTGYDEEGAADED